MMFIPIYDTSCPLFSICTVGCGRPDVGKGLYDAFCNTNLPQPTVQILLLLYLLDNFIIHDFNRS